MNFDEHFLVLVLALLLDRIIGDPQWMWMRVPHPVAIFGKAIGYFDQHFNREILSKAQRRQNGVVVILALSVLAVVTGLVLHWFLMHDNAGNRGRIEAKTREILALPAVPILLGGDDSVPIPFLAGFADHGPVWVLQIDAHIDWRDELHGCVRLDPANAAEFFSMTRENGLANTRVVITR